MLGSLRYSDDQSPVAAAEVSLFLKGIFPGEEQISWRARTDDFGQFMFPALPARRTFLLSASGPSLPRFQPLELIATGLEARELRPLSVPRGVCHEGFVVDSAGKPVVGVIAELFAVRQLSHPDALFGFQGSGRPIPISHCATDNKGRFSVWRPVTEAEGLLEVSGRGFARKTVVLRRNAEPLTVQLEAGVSVEGRVVDPDGDPVRGVSVYAFVSSGPNLAAALPRARSATNGRFVLTGLSPTSSYRILADFAVRGFLWPSHSEPGRAAPEGQHTVVVSWESLKAREEVDRNQFSARFVGQVFDAKTERPIKGAQIELWPPGHSKHSEIGSATGKTGAFEVANLWPGSEYLLTVRAFGYEPVFDDVVLTSTPFRKSYRLEAIDTVDIIVQSTDGDAVANVPVSVFVGTTDISHAYSRGITDTNGRVRLGEASRKHILRGVSLFAGSMGYGWRTMPDGISDEAVIFEIRPDQVTGRVLDEAGSPIVGASIAVLGTTFFSDSDGVFVIPNVVARDSAWIYSQGLLSTDLEISPQLTGHNLDVTLSRDTKYQVRLVDDEGNPVVGAVNNGQVSNHEGELFVAEWDRVEIDTPGHLDMTVEKENSYFSTEFIDTSKYRLVPGRNTFVVPRTGSVRVQLPPGSLGALTPSDDRTISVERDGRYDSPSFRERPVDDLILLDRVLPGEYKLRIERLGPFLPISIDRVVVAPHRTTEVRVGKLVEGATLVVTFTNRPQNGKDSWFEFAFTCESGGGPEVVFVALAPTGERIRGLPSGAGWLEIEAPDGYYAFRRRVTNLQQGRERTVKVAFEPFPVVSGRVFLPVTWNPQKTAWLHFEPAGESDLEAVTAELGSNGTFSQSLHHGVYRMEILESEREDPDSPFSFKEPELSATWQPSGPGEIRVQRGRDVTDLNVKLEPQNEPR